MDFMLQRPLKADELCHALAVEVGTTDLNVCNVPSIRTLMSCTLGLVTIDRQSSIVRLVHFTLQEYLAAHPNLFITPHSMMAEVCLTYLNFRSVCEFSTTLHTIPANTPLLYYAACCWGFHSRKDVTEGVQRLALRLLQQDANHISAYILLNEKTVDFLSSEDRYYGSHPDLQGYTGLHCIAYMGITEIAIAMVDMKLWDLNGRDSKGATPLIWAIKYGNSTLAKILLDQGDVDPTLSDKEGRTPLAYAAQVGLQDVVELLLQRGNVNPDSRSEWDRTPLSYAAEFGHEGVVKILLERGDVNPNMFHRIGMTPLLFAAESGHAGVVKMLLERGDVNPNLSNWAGRIPLSLAAEFGYEGIVKILLERGDVISDLSGRERRTPLSYAAEYGHEGTVKILLERGDVNPDSPAQGGRTPLSYAAKSGHEGIAKILLKRGDVNPDSSDQYGRTPLSVASQSGHDDIVKMLLERRDVNPGSVDRDGRTAFNYAQQSGHTGVMRLLREPRPFIHKTLDTGGPMTEISSPAQSAQEEVKSGAVAQQEGIVPDIKHEITVATPLPLPAQPPLNQLDEHPPAPVLAPRLTSDSAPDSTSLKPSRLPKRRIKVTCQPLRRSKRRRTPAP